MIIYPHSNSNSNSNSTVNKVPLTTNNANLLDDYFQSKHDILHFDTQEGIFEIASNKIYKIAENSDLENYPFSNEILFMI